MEYMRSDGFERCVVDCADGHSGSRGWTDPPSACNLAGFEATLCKTDLDCADVVRLREGKPTECSELMEEQEAQCE